MKSLQRFARFDPELVDERMPSSLVCGERLCLSIRAVNRKHLLCAQPFAQRMLADEHLQLAENVLVTTLRKVAVDSIQQRRES